MGRREPLRFEEREIISRELSRNPKCSSRFLGKILGRHHSTIAREIDRNGGAKDYRAVGAQARAEANVLRPKARKLETSQRLHDAVNEGVRETWSPNQISRRLGDDHPDDPELHVSHETIDECLYLQARGQVRTELTLALRQGRTRRVTRSRATATRGRILDMINNSERPTGATDRAVPGFWEGDLVRHEALCFRAEVKDLRRCVVAAA